MRQLVKQLNYKPLCRWFVGLTIDDVVWNRLTLSLHIEAIQVPHLAPGCDEVVDELLLCGTNAASRAMKSNGLKYTWVVPLDKLIQQRVLGAMALVTRRIGN